MSGNTPGPDRKPIEFKALAGTLKPSREEERAASDAIAAGGESGIEFDKVSELPRPPQFLNVDGVAMWKTLGTMLVRCGLLQEPDFYSFTQLCYRWQNHAAKMKAGLPIATADDAMLNTLFNQFGINPAARRRVVRYIAPNPGSAPASEPKPNRFAQHGRRPTAA